MLVLFFLIKWFILNIKVRKQTAWLCRVTATLSHYTCAVPAGDSLIILNCTTVSSSKNIIMILVQVYYYKINNLALKWHFWEVDPLRWKLIWITTLLVCVSYSLVASTASSGSSNRSNLNLKEKCCIPFSKTPFHLFLVKMILKGFVHVVT